MPANSPASTTSHYANGNMPQLLVYAMLLLAAVKLGIQCWGANKGFDIWDEGLYILMLNFYDQYPTEPHNYYSYVMAALLPLKAYGLLPLRYLAIAVETTGILFFAYSIHRFFACRATAPFRYTIGVLPLMLFTFLGAGFLSVYPRAFSYNDFSYFSTLAISGSLMLYFRHGRPLPTVARAGGLVLLFFIGGLLGAQLVVKFSTCLLLLGWVVVFTVFLSNQSKPYRIALLLALVAGGATFLFVLFGSYAGFATWLHHLNEGVALLRKLAYEPYYIIVKGYLYVDVVLNGVYFLVPLLVAYLTHRLLKQLSKATAFNQHLAAFALGSIAWLVCSLTIHYGFLGEFHYRFIALHIFTMLYWGIPVVRQLIKAKQYPWLLVIALLSALPIMALLGSSNTATQTLTRYLASWFALIALFVGYRFKDNAKAFVAVAAFLISFCGVNYIVVQVYNPYGLNAPLTAQNTTVNGLYYLEDILLDPPSAQFFVELKEATAQTGYQPGWPILALGDLCGAATAMGGYIPETFWYFSDENAISAQHSRNYSCLHLNNLRIAEHEALPLVYINSGINKQVVDCLGNSEIPFPEAYYLQRTIFNPYAQESLAIWAPLQWQIRGQ